MPVLPCHNAAMGATADQLGNKDAERSYGINYFKSLISESDRGCVLLAAARLDDSLKRLHTAHIQATVDVSNKWIEELFESHAPLSVFSDRIKLAYAYGFLSREDYDDLELIRKLRNKAAHTGDDFSLSNSPYCDWVNALRSASRDWGDLAAQLQEFTKHLGDTPPYSGSPLGLAAKVRLILNGINLDASITEKTCDIMDRRLKILQTLKR
jgi:hypothetical protein